MTQGFFGEISCQTSPIYEKHTNYPQFVNPSLTGRDPYPFVNLSAKKTFSGGDHLPYTLAVGGAFRLGYLNFYTHNMMLNKGKVMSRNRMGLGGMLLYEQNGPLKQTYLSFNYAYHLPLNEAQTYELSFGIMGQARHIDINEQLLDPNDPGDPELLNLDNQPMNFDASFGVSFHTLQFYTGFSLNELLSTESPLEDEDYYLNRSDFTAHAGYKFFLPLFDVEPSAFIAQIDNDPLYYALQLKAYYQSYNWASISYKSTEAIVVGLGIRVGRAHVAYLFEQNIGGFSSFYGTFHELSVGLNIGLFEPEGLRKTVKR